ncbi:class II fumarate hydratase [Terrilactibacillus laevilacticus]|uniref:Fumarate hydratase class II n=1 Tax=Terrilactibacillus laevilacticus TaxID=1380157 RepID=A0ABW5PQF3_9BACI|nr:class II fumarate hydratase [Terrilactibacillus laevilacticus]
MGQFRIEKDTLGEIKVPTDAQWGAQTQRSLQNFAIGKEKMPIEIIQAFALLKKAAASVNQRLGKLDKNKAEAIEQAADEVLEGKWNDQFPLVVWQTGSGTQSNMNMNEVLAHLGNRILDTQKTQLRIHPNDDVNQSQSSNDTFPTAMHIAAVMAIKERLVPALHQLQKTLEIKSKEFNDIIKIGRTHLQDATPLTLGQEISGWAYMMKNIESMLNQTIPYISSLAIGGTAVGTGINAHPDFGRMVAEELSHLTGNDFVSSENKFHALTSHDELVTVHGVLKALASNLMKIANDVRWLASGPRCGIGEITIPANEPGSSIMPGKVNPTQAEAVTMVAVQVMGNDSAIGFAASQGNFELNVFKPLIAYNFIQSVQLLSDVMVSFNKNCLEGLEPNIDQINKYLHGSLMLVTALNPHIGYEKSAQIAKLAHQKGISLKEAALETGILTEQQFDAYVDPKKMVHPS